jgi:putative copper resistance protein D
LLVTSPYGRILLVKVALVAAMIAIAIGNRFLLSPRIAATGPAGGAVDEVAVLFRSVAVEQGVGLLVLATVAVLGTIHPLP